MTALSGWRRTGRLWPPWLALAAAAISLAGSAAGVLLHLGNRALTSQSYHLLPGDLIIATTFPAVGAFLVRHRPDNRVGWVMVTASLIGVNTFAAQYTIAGTAPPGALPLVPLAAWVTMWAWTPFLLLPTLLPLLFPDGRLPSPRWRPVAVAVLVLFGITVVSVAIRPGPIEPTSAIANPLGLDGASWLAAVQAVGSFGLYLVAAPLCVLGLVLRQRRAAEPERTQLQWLMAGGLVAVVSGPITQALSPLPFAWNDVVWGVALSCIPLAILLAVIRHGLLDIEVIISRSLVYGGLTAAVVGVYVATVGLLGAVFQHRGLGVSLLATGVVAVGFQPLREWLQRGVDRLLYGHRDDPYAVLSQLGQRLAVTMAPEAALPGVVETVAQALKLPYVAVELRHGDRFGLAASVGGRVEATVRLPLVYHGDVVGRLVVAPRGPGERFSAADLRLLADVARHAGVAAHAVGLTAELQRSRQQLVTAREEERRRLRRDLHDGLGPTLAGTVLQLGTVTCLVDQDPAAAQGLLDRLRGEVRQAIVDIRRLVYQLRPPALDELGLVGALREQATHFSGQADLDASRGPALAGRLLVEVEAAADLPPLAAAVEVAAYRIATEAMANAARHAQARTCTVRLALDGALELEVCDDGHGLPDRYQAGIGLGSMRERAAELGGTCIIQAAPGGGTRIHAHLPLPELQEI